MVMRSNASYGSTVACQRLRLGALFCILIEIIPQPVCIFDLILHDPFPSGIGAKTSLMRRFEKNVFTTNTNVTYGVEFGLKEVDIDGARVRLQIWDTAGQVRFPGLSKAHYREAGAIVLGYDITCRTSFLHLEFWKSEFPSHLIEKVVLVGNKCDLRERRQVTYEEGKALADQNGWVFFETSAKNNINVTETFMAAARMGLQKVANINLRCRKFDPAAVVSPSWDVIFVNASRAHVAFYKTAEDAAENAISGHIAIFGCICRTLHEYEGSHNILVISPACDKDEKVEKPDCYLSFDDSRARDNFLDEIMDKKRDLLCSVRFSLKCECSNMRSPLRLLSAIKQGVSEDVETLSIAGNAVRLQDVSVLTKELCKFLALTCLDVSANPELGGVGIAAILSSVSGCKLTSVNISGTGLALEGAQLVLEQLCKFSALKHLKISDNPAFRLLPVGLLQFATRLDTLACDGFSQNLFSTPEENPVRIRHLFQSFSDETPWEVNLSASELTFAPVVVEEVANLFRILPVLDCLDLSANEKLGSWGVCDFLNSLTGAQASSLRYLSLSRMSLQNEGVPKLADQLKRLPKLRRLDLSGNPGLCRDSISLFIDALQAAREFVELHLCGSSVEALPENFCRSLPKLENLFLDDCNSLNGLPVALGSLKNLNHISVQRCSALVYPPRSLQPDPSKIAQFLMGAHSNSESWRRVKVAFLGNGRSGKTSLLRSLAKKTLRADEQSTPGITVDAFSADLEPNLFDRARYGWDLELSWWDFAGQLEYSAAHEFFMSSRQALYVIVFSVLDEDEIIMQQLLHWISVVPALVTCPHVRLMVVGTKIDLILPSALKTVLKMKRGIVHRILDIMGITDKVHPSDIQFVSASQAFDCPEQQLSWKSSRKDLKDRIYYNCVDILDGGNSDFLKYPKEYKQMRRLVSKLHEQLKAKQQLLPCCRLDHEDAVNVLGSILEEKSFLGQRKSSLATSDRSNYFKSDLVASALDVLNDLGIIVIYGGRGHNTLVGAQSVPSICVEPQLLPGIMSLLVDPQTKLPAVVTADALLNLLETQPKISRISHESPPELKAQLLELLESVGMVRQYGSSHNFLVPLALRGRPARWSHIVPAGLSEDLILQGQRFGIGHTANISTTYFMKILLNKCVDAKRMWGSAFAYDIEQGAGNSVGCVFVRLLEDRRSIDVVVLMNMDVVANIDLQVVMQREFDSIAQLMGGNLNGANDRMYLCPMCCSANLFVQSGAVHSFYLQEVSSCPSFHCSRYHCVTDSNLTEGKIVKLDLNDTPALYPSHIQELQLPWLLAAAGGIALPQMLSDNMCEEDTGEGYQSGKFLDISFFVLTGQVSAGMVLQSEDLERFQSFIASCSDECSPFPPYSDRFLLKYSVNSFDVQLQFCFKIGDMPASPGGRKILSIHAADVGDALEKTPSMDSFSCLDNVLVIFEQSADDKMKRKHQFIIFPGKRHDLCLCRLTPAYCSINSQAARCWSELQDYFAVVMGPEFLNYEIKTLTVFRNDDRAHAFMQQMDRMKCCKRDVVPPWRNHGQIAADAVASLFGNASAIHCQEFAREFNWLHYKAMEDDELKHELQKYGVDSTHTDKALSIIRQLQYTFEAQDATMQHFEEHARKFGLVPLEENADVNLTLGWWGHWKGNAV